MWELMLLFLLGGLINDWLLSNGVGLESLKKPICERWLGANKNWNWWFVFCCVNVSICCFFSLFLAGLGPVYIGFGGTVAWGLGGLPTSFVKRRLGIPPGESSLSHPTLQWVCEHIDSSAALALYLVFVLGYETRPVLMMLPLAVLAHGAHNIVTHALFSIS